MAYNISGGSFPFHHTKKAIFGVFYEATTK
jgi:hypothetical protein